MDVIIRKTWGWRKTSDAISLSQLVEMTGMKKYDIIPARKKLIQMNMIIVAQKGNGDDLTYAFQKNYDEWVPLPKKATLPKKAKTVAQEGNKSLPKTPPTKETYTKETIKTISKPVMPAELSESFIEKAKIAGQLGFNVYQQVNRYTKGKCNSIPEVVMGEIVDEFLKHREAIKDIFPYMARVIQEKSRRYFSEKNVADHEAIKKQPMNVGDIMRQLAGASA